MRNFHPLEIGSRGSVKTKRQGGGGVKIKLYNLATTRQGRGGGNIKYNLATTRQGRGVKN